LTLRIHPPRGNSCSLNNAIYDLSRQSSPSLSCDSSQQQFLPKAGLLSGPQSTGTTA